MNLRSPGLLGFVVLLSSLVGACGADDEAAPEWPLDAALDPLIGDGGTSDASTWNGDSAAPLDGSSSGDGASADAAADGALGDGSPGSDAAQPVFLDPGSAPWQLVPEAQVAEQCKLDPALLKEANGKINTAYAVVRYGKLCHEFIPSVSDAPAEVWSATKTLGALVTGIASYETRTIPRSGPKTGQLKDTDRADHWLDAGSISFNREALLAHVLAMIGHNTSLAYGSRTYAYDTIGTTQINRLSDVVNTAIKQDSARLGANIELFTKKFLFDAIGMTSSTWSNGGTTKTYAYSWSSTLRDMARVGLLMLHRGSWAGKRVLDESWIYKMTHPAFEDSNTAYGYLTWLNARSGGTGPGGAGTGVGGDACAPAAVWQSYPHAPSEAMTCLYQAPNSCAQQHDVGVWSAQGLGGQFIVGHAGLDLVIIAKNYANGGPAGLWQHLRPALVKLDPTYKGDETAFCAAYGANKYAPDLIGQVVQPTP